MKKILALILAILMMLFAFAACDTSESEKQEKSTEKQTEKLTETEKATEKNSLDNSSNGGNNENNNANNNNNAVDNDNNDSNTITTENYTRIENKILFGSYPQTKVSDTSLITALNTIAGTLPTSNNSQAWTSYGYYMNCEISNYMWYIDIENSGEKYRGVYFTSYRPQYMTVSASSDSSTYQDDNGYITNTVYWFKYEPISWTILNENTAEGTALLLCDMIIDSQEYYRSIDTRTIDGKTIYSNNYAQSTIRKWLNETFYNTAFTKLQMQIILTTTVDNSVASTSFTSNSYVCEDTSDKIFLLSTQEITNPAYGFDSNTVTSDTARIKKSTDYAQSQGINTNNGNGNWWLRSPSNNYNKMAGGIYFSGYISNNNIDFNSLGVVPALQIKLQ